MIMEPSQFQTGLEELLQRPVTNSEVKSNRANLQIEVASALYQLEETGILFRMDKEKQESLKTALDTSLDAGREAREKLNDRID